MLSIRTIVHPIDFAPADHAALLHSAHLARHHGAALYVIYVAPPMGPLPAFDADQACASAVLHEQEMRDHMSEHIRAFVEAEGVHGVQVQSLFIPHATPAAGILAFACEVDADLIVTGALGSAAEQVVREAPCPVLVVRPGASGDSIQRVVAALDLASTDEETAAYAAALAEVYGAPLELSHVVEAVHSPALGQAAADGYAHRIEGHERWAETELHALGVRLVGEEKTCVRVEAGFAPDVIVAHARAAEGQLLVLGRRGPAGGRGLNYHGVTVKVLREAPCSVFVVAPKGKGLLMLPALAFDASGQALPAFSGG